MTVTPAELEAARGRSVPDLVGSQPKLVFVGVNPGLWTAATGAHFARPGNRFYPALHLAGITAWRIDASGGYRPGDRWHLIERGIAVTNLVERATARADELDRAELRAGARRLETKVRRWAPQVVAVVGITAYRQAFGRPRAGRGRQPEDLAGAALWVLGNPSGLNAHDQVPTLAAGYRQAAAAAGLELGPARL